MREIETPNYEERRDALAQDWGVFLEFSIPEAIWIAVPNLGLPVVDYFRDWELNALILTGGNDIGSSKCRDETEMALLDLCRANSLPVFGVCRGMQMIQHHRGGSLTPCDPNIHVAATHDVKFLAEPLLTAASDSVTEVNSYHSFGIREDELHGELTPTAITADNWIEACADPQTDAVGVMWHPERGRPFRVYDRTLIRSTFGLA